MARPAVVLYSGGPDSLITLRFAERGDWYPVIPAYAQLGHRYEEAEMRAILATVPETVFTEVMSGLGAWEEDDAHIWGRNAFLCLAAAKLLPEKVGGDVLLTVQEDEMSIPDRSAAFLRPMSRLLTVLRGAPTEVISPWERSDKTDMVKWYLENVDDHQGAELKKTTSCYSPVSIRRSFGSKKDYFFQCGDCPACFRRWVAFYLNGIAEKFAEKVETSKTAELYLNLAKRGIYSQKRCHRILTAMGYGFTEG